MSSNNQQQEPNQTHTYSYPLEKHKTALEQKNQHSLIRLIQRQQKITPNKNRKHGE